MPAKKNKGAAKQSKALQSRKQKTWKKKSGIMTLANVQKGANSKIPRGPFRQSNSINPFPPQMRAKLVYVDDLDIRATVSTGYPDPTYVYKYGMNTCYDPYLPAGGHQPYGFDQICSATGPYTRYKVTGVKIEATFYDANATTGSMAVCMVNNPIQTYTIGGKAVDALSEQPGCVVKHLTATGKQEVTIKQYFPMHEMFGWGKEQFKVEMGSTTGAYNGNPGTIPYFEVGLLDTRQTAVTARCKLKITYYTIFYERWDLAQS